MKAINGNVKVPTLRYLHWNKGCSNFKNKLDDIKIIIDKFRPHIFSIVEANYDLNDRITIQGYSIEADNMMSNNKLARTIILIDNQINYDRLTQYDSKGISCVWLKLEIGSKNNPIVMAGYR